MTWIARACVVIGSLTSCAGPPGPGDRTGAAALYEDATARMRDGDLAGAFDDLQAALRAGYPTPSDVLCAEDFRELLDAPPWRRRLRELLEASARESALSMVRPDEPGEAMILTVRIVAGRDEPPVAVRPTRSRAGILVGLNQVDAAGYYQPWTEEQDWNPRLFAFARTDATGAIAVRTIRPGHYAPEYEAPEYEAPEYEAPEYEAPDEPAHVHYDVTVDGVLLRASEFFFEDDPRLVGEARREAEEHGVPIASVVRDGDGLLRADVTIPVRGLR